MQYKWKWRRVGQGAGVSDELQRATAWRLTDVMHVLTGKTTNHHFANHHFTKPNNQDYWINGWGHGGTCAHRHTRACERAHSHTHAHAGDFTVCACDLAWTDSKFIISSNVIVLQTASSQPISSMCVDQDG